jgi:uncharacterized protein
VRPLLRFFLLTYAVTWTFFIAAVTISHKAALSDQTTTVVAGLFVFAGTIAPALVAIAVSVRAGGISRTRALLDRLFLWRMGARWYVFAVGYMATIKFMVGLTHRVMIGSWPRFDHQPFVVVIATMIVSTPFQSGEEIGWRGYALPLLAERIGFARGSVLLGLVWGCWHLPLFFLRVPGNDEYGQSFPVWALGVTALSVAFAWLYTHVNGSLLLTMLMHSAVNNTPHFVLSATADEKSIFSPHASRVAWLTAIFLWIAAACFLVGMRHIDPPWPRQDERCAP